MDVSLLIQAMAAFALKPEKALFLSVLDLSQVGVSTGLYFFHQRQL
jgi:hypothetical protein